MTMTDMMSRIPNADVPIVTVNNSDADVWHVVVRRVERDPYIIAKTLSRNRAEAIAAELRGALADAFHAGSRFANEEAAR